MPVFEGSSPQIMLTLEGLQIGAWQWAFMKTEPRAASSEPVHVRSYCLGMPAVDAYPVVQVVDCYEKHIRRFGLNVDRSGGHESQHGEQN